MHQRIGIVGSEAAKFTRAGRNMARYIITKLLTAEGVTAVVSGACHLGGIDQWAAEIGRDLGLIVIEFAPKTRSWSSGYKPRNIQIAQTADITHCITVDMLPRSYVGMKFDKCYHCNTDEHVKSGGCWTMLYAQNVCRKPGKLHVVTNWEDSEQ